MPSRTEGLPRALIEAMARGCRAWDEGGWDSGTAGAEDSCRRGSGVAEKLRRCCPILARLARCRRAISRRRASSRMKLVAAAGGVSGGVRGDGMLDGRRRRLSSDPDSGRAGVKVDAGTPGRQTSDGAVGGLHRRVLVGLAVRSMSPCPRRRGGQSASGSGRVRGCTGATSASPGSLPWNWPVFDAIRRLVPHVPPDLIHSHFVTTTLALRLALGPDTPTPRLFQVPGPLHLEHALYRRMELSSAGPSDYWVASSDYIRRIYVRYGVGLVGSSCRTTASTQSPTALNRGGTATSAAAWASGPRRRSSATSISCTRPSTTWARPPA